MIHVDTTIEALSNTNWLTLSHASCLANTCMWILKQVHPGIWIHVCLFEEPILC